MFDRGSPISTMYSFNFGYSYSFIAIIRDSVCQPHTFLTFLYRGLLFLLNISLPRILKVLYLQYIQHETISNCPTGSSDST